MRRRLTGLGKSLVRTGWILSTQMKVDIEKENTSYIRARKPAVWKPVDSRQLQVEVSLSKDVISGKSPSTGFRGRGVVPQQNLHFKDLLDAGTGNTKAVICKPLKKRSSCPLPNQEELERRAASSDLWHHRLRIPFCSRSFSWSWDQLCEEEIKKKLV